MAGPGDEMSTAGRGRPRASDADREQVIDMLKAAFVQGLLTKDELDARVGRALGMGETLAMVDGDAGSVIFDPEPETRRLFEQRMAA